jgi:hypothetical protein
MQDRLRALPFARLSYSSVGAAPSFNSRFPAVPRPLRYFILIEIIKVDTVNQLNLSSINKALVSVTIAT